MAEWFNKGMDESEAIWTAHAKGRTSTAASGFTCGMQGGKLCPTLSPREEDLLRRCVLSQTDCVGLDLGWWGAYHGNSSPASAADVSVKKVLMGRFLLRDGREAVTSYLSSSLKPARLRRSSHQDVAADGSQAQSRKALLRDAKPQAAALLLTQQVGDSRRALSHSLSCLCCRPSKDWRSNFADCGGCLLPNCPALARSPKSRVAVSELLWQWHDPARACVRCGERYRGAEGGSPIQLLETLKVRSDWLWVKNRSCTHGDLNATNIALDRVGDTWRAYIFDAEGVKADVAVRDLAMLEVTSLLHRNIALDEHFL